MDSPVPKHVSVRKHSAWVQDYFRSNNIPPEQDIVLVAEILSYMLLSTESNKLSSLFATQSAKFSLRKLSDTLLTIRRFFSL